MDGVRIGVALGTGGARGWCHIGALNALAELGIVPDVVAGCSMGALVGAAHAAGRLAALEEWARGLTLARMAGMLDVGLTSGGLVRGRELERVLGDIGVPEEIGDLERPFAAVATDIATGREVWLRKGRVHDAVRASIAIPGVISPHRVGSRWLLDGGMANPVPISVCRALGADVVIAVNPNARGFSRYWPPERRIARREDLAARLGQLLPVDMAAALGALIARDGDRPPGYADVIAASTTIMTETIRRARLAAEPPDVQIDVRILRIMVLELHRAAEAIEAGHAATMAEAETIMRAVEAASA